MPRNQLLSVVAPWNIDYAAFDDCLLRRRHTFSCIAEQIAQVGADVVLYLLLRLPSLALGLCPPFQTTQVGFTCAREVHIVGGFLYRFQPFIQFRLIMQFACLFAVFLRDVAIKPLRDSSRADEQGLCNLFEGFPCRPSSEDVDRVLSL